MRSRWILQRTRRSGRGGKNNDDSASRVGVPAGHVSPPRIGTAASAATESQRKRGDPDNRGRFTSRGGLANKTNALPEAAFMTAGNFLVPATGAKRHGEDGVDDTNLSKRHCQLEYDSNNEAEAMDDINHSDQPSSRPGQHDFVSQDRIGQAASGENTASVEDTPAHQRHGQFTEMRQVRQTTRALRPGPPTRTPSNACDAEEGLPEQEASSPAREEVGIEFHRTDELTIKRDAQSQILDLLRKDPGKSTVNFMAPHPDTLRYIVKYDLSAKGYHIRREVQARLFRETGCTEAFGLVIPVPGQEVDSLFDFQFIQAVTFAEPPKSLP